MLEIDEALPARRLQKIGEETMMEMDTDHSLPSVGAPAPKRILSNSFASVGLRVAILPGKYADPLPLYRQEQIFKVRHGVELRRKTMCDWVWCLAHPLAMIYEKLRDEIRSA